MRIFATFAIFVKYGHQKSHIVFEFFPIAREEFFDVTWLAPKFLETRNLGYVLTIISARGRKRYCKKY